MSAIGRITRRVFVGILASLFGDVAVAQRRGLRRAVPETEQGPNQALRYTTPTASFVQALPIGNGRLGAMVSGDPRHEQLVLNEDTLWSGKPHDWNNPGARAVLPQIRTVLLDDADYHAANHLTKRCRGRLTSRISRLGSCIWTSSTRVRSPSMSGPSISMKPSPRCVTARRTRSSNAKRSSPGRIKFSP